MHTAERPPCRATLASLALLAAALAMVGCGGDGEASANPPVTSPAPTPAPPPAATNVSTFAGGLANPWGMSFLPDGRLLVTQKGGTLVLVSADGGTRAHVSGVPAVAANGQGGLLDVAIDPDFTTTPWVYLSYAEAGPGGSGTAVARGRLVGHALQDVAVIFRQAPKVAGDGHFGSRLVFRSDKTLFITLGERQLGQPAQDLTGTLGKVVRIHRDGSVPTDNPHLGNGAAVGIWSLGHRNPQGAAVHPTTGELWQSEHGPQGGDEINIARAGQNYGWPQVSYGCDYGASYTGNDNTSCRIGGTGGVHAPAYVEPLTYWVPVSQAPAGLAFYTAGMFPEWQGNLFMGALAGTGVWRLTLSGNTVSAREKLPFSALGVRIRDVRQGPDGALYVLTDGSAGSVLRIGR